MAGPWANIWSMQADASLNLFTTKEDPDDTSALKNDARWRIQTKFETPMLNFNYLTNSDITLNASADANYKNAVNNVIPRGIWHQFGRLPLADEGVYMQVTDIPDDWLNNHPSSSVIFDAAGQMDSRNYFGIAAEPGTGDEASFNLTGYRLPLNMGAPAQAGTKVTERPKSLVDICGFSTDPVRIGEVPNVKKVFEAIVAVPFVEEEGERRFLKISGTDVRRFATVPAAVAKGSESILRLENMLEKYVFPPTFDFVHNDVDAVAMYVFEFAHKFTKNDLSHMWQNLSPKLGTVAEPALATVSHKLLKDQLLNFSATDVANAGALSAADRADGSFKMPKAEFPEKLQWMVFKVKQRAKTNYYEQIGSDKEVTVPFYTDNWPYDFFSMVELASIDAEVTFTPTKKNLSIKEKKREAANTQLQERSKEAPRRPIDVNIIGETD